MAENFGAGPNLDEVSTSSSGNKDVVGRLSVPQWCEGRRKEKQTLYEEIEKILMGLCSKSWKSAGFCINPIGGWDFRHYLKCFLYEINKFYTGLSVKNSVECLVLFINDGNLYKIASDITDIYLKDKTIRTQSGTWSSGGKETHGKQEILWTYPNNKVVVLLKDTTCDADVVITPVSGDPVYKIIKVTIEEGQLHEAQAEALVNTISNDLDLTNGTISASLLKKAGHGLQKEIKKNWKPPVRLGVVLKTGACNLPLPCKAVYHGALKTYHPQDDSVSIFRQFLHDCLEQASKSKYKSIAFPAIGTGNLSYPKDVVASLMLTAAMEFEKSMPNTSLKEVKFVIHPDSTETYQAFQNQLQNLQSGHKGGRVMTIASIPGRTTHKSVVIIEVNQGNNHPVSLVKSVEFPIYASPLAHKSSSSERGVIPKTQWQSLKEVNKGNNYPVSAVKSTKYPRYASSSSERGVIPKTQWQSLKDSEGSFAENTVRHAQKDQKCCFILSGDIKGKKDLEERLSSYYHQFNQPKHIVYPYEEKSALLIFEKEVDVETLQPCLKRLIVEQLQPKEVKFLVPGGLVERLHTTGQKETLFTNLKEISGVEVTLKDNRMYLIGVTTHQIDIAKHYLEEFEKKLNIKMNKQSNSMSSSSLDEKWDNHSDSLNNVSEVEFRALEILEHGFKRIQNAQLSWNSDAILICGPAAVTTVVKTDLIRQLSILRNKQSVEIALDEKEKKIVKDVMKDVQSEDTFCVYDKKWSQVVVYSDKQDDIMKFKHKLKFQTGKLKVNVRSRKRFAENPQLLETSQENCSSSFRSAEIRQELSWSKNALDVVEFYTKENIKVAVYMADILNLPVDCIVNAANDNLQHGGGVARVIADAAGPRLVQEGDAIIRKEGKIPVGCQVTTNAGRLPYKCVIHTVGPCWSDYQPHNLQKVADCEKDLYAAIHGCFIEAEKNGHSSVALPAVSSGIYAVPQEMCAVQYAKAVLDFSGKSTQGQSLKEIHFVDKLPHLVKLMQDTFKIMIQNGKVPNYNIQNYAAFSSDYQRLQSKETGRKGHRQQDVAVNNSQYKTTKPNKLSPIYYEPLETHKRHFVFQVSVKPVVHIYEGNILRLKNIDAIVCPYDSEGSGIGRIASELQKKTKYRQNKDKCFKNQKPDIGDVVITHGEENPFNVIVHVVIENNSPQRQEFKSTVQKSVDNILRKTNEWANVKTIALPLFGVKRELLTQKLWAESFLDRFVSFCCEVENPNLEEVHIITHFSSSSAYSTVTKVFIDFVDESSKAHSHQKETPPRPPSPEVYRTCDDTQDRMSGQIHESKNGDSDTDDSCSICMCAKTEPKFLSCGHSFCSECIASMLKHKPVCAVCGRIVGTLTGNQPNDGRMYVKTSLMNLAGYEGHGCIEITYDFPAGKQGPDHPSPGARYGHMTRTAYLPNMLEGTKVCRMLQLAFERRLVFTISTSRTTGKEGLTWNDIHHKTNPNPGTQFGYPDPEYLSRVKDELAAKGITEADLPQEETGLSEYGSPV